jgi:hypothetical protein
MTCDRSPGYIHNQHVAEARAHLETLMDAKNLPEASRGFTTKHEASGLDAQQLQGKMTSFVLLLNQQYGAQCVREVLKALNDKITGPLN